MPSKGYLSDLKFCRAPLIFVSLTPRTRPTPQDLPRLLTNDLWQNPQRHENGRPNEHPTIRGERDASRLESLESFHLRRTPFGERQPRRLSQVSNSDQPIQNRYFPADVNDISQTVQPDHQWTNYQSILGLQTSNIWGDQGLPAASLSRSFGPNLTSVRPGQQFGSGTSTGQVNHGFRSRPSPQLCPSVGNRGRNAIAPPSPTQPVRDATHRRLHSAQHFHRKPVSIPQANPSYLRHKTYPALNDPANGTLPAYEWSSEQTQQMGLPYPIRDPMTNKDEFSRNIYHLPQATHLGLSLGQGAPAKLPNTLSPEQRAQIFAKLDYHLCRTAFQFFAEHRFPIPFEKHKRIVTVPSDRCWNEWAYLLKRLATKRRVPTSVLHGGQIKHMVTLMENSLIVRHPQDGSCEPIEDDMHMLQVLSAGIQVAKLLRDYQTMEILLDLYSQTQKMSL